MTETLEPVTDEVDQQELAEQLLAQAKEQGVDLVGPDELLNQLTNDVEIRRVICSTNAIESVNARYRRAIRARGHFPTEQAALKCLYLVTRSLDPTGKGKARWATRWKPALNAFAITFEGRITPTGN
jgi:putative transposase